MKNNRDKEVEDNSQDLVDKSQLLEFIIMLGIVNEIESALNNDSSTKRSESLNNIRKSIKKETKEFVKNSMDDINLMIDNSNKSAYKEIFRKGANNIDYSQISLGYAKKLEKEFKKNIKTKNIVIGNKTPQQFFSICIEKSVKDITEGNTTIEKAIDNAIHEISKSGVKIIHYESGTTRNIDVWVRQQCMYVQKESTRDITMSFSKANDITIFEFDAHPDARPTHQIWQGKRFDEKGIYYPTHDELNNFQDEDYGCLHYMFPVWDPNDKYMFSKEELDNINTPQFEFNGNLYDGYSAKKKARSLERDIRRLKREKNLRDKKGLDTTEIKAKLSSKNKQYKNFMKSYGTYPRTNRTSVKS